ncbi:hypothetical protein [Herpetosiphon giganteus]|uniref:hypothetical protein n=1 Tax=Herpetosiphon giganteus TaxID=2029754 RepID=UPI00195B703A|nr:hypothetical protein [Herpetosiphon giganteus]MBM7844655.1 hypothetical protein [Herpetosiphon giganteus]
MDEEWDIHSSRRPTIGQYIGLAKREYEAAMQALEPDPNADALTYLDQQWAKESVKYTGMQTSHTGMPVQQSPMVLIVLCSVFASVLVATIVIGFRSHMPQLYCFSLFSLLFVVMSGFGIRNQLRFATAKKRYLAQRAALIAQLGIKPQDVPRAPVIEKPLIHKSVTTSAANQIRQLQYHYHSINDQEQYRRSVLSIIAQAPEHERQYLKALAAIESEWVQERLKYVSFKNGRREQRANRPTNVWFVGGICVFFATAGIMQGLSTGNWVNVLGALVIPTILASITVYSNQRVKAYRALEEKYAERRNQLHGRFRDQAPF